MNDKRRISMSCSARIDAVRRKSPALVAPKRDSGLVEVVTEFNRSRGCGWLLARTTTGIYY